MKIFRKWSQRIITAVSFVSLLSLAGCGQSDSESLRVGVMAGPEAELMQIAAREYEKRYDSKVKLVEFQDFVTPNIALIEGSVDVNAFQHKPYMDNMVKDRGFAIKAAGNTFIYPIGAYSKKIKSMDQLPVKGKVALPNDPTNEGRALLMLHKAGIIQLNNPKNLTVTPIDIIENKKHLTFVELDAAQIPRALEDVDLALINSVYAVAANLYPKRDAILLEDKESPYVNIFAVRVDEQAAIEKIRRLVEIYQSDIIASKANELFKGSAIPGWTIEHKN